MDATPSLELNVAIDIGFHAIKVAAVVGGDLITTTLPAVVGVGETDLGLLQVGLTRQVRGQKPFVICIDGQTYLVGPHVAQYARPIERLDFDRLSYSPELQSLTYVALVNLLAQIAGIDLGYAQVSAALNLVVALPVMALQSQEARSIVQILENWMVGEHNFDVNNQHHHLNIRAVKAMAQPLGGFFEWGLGLDGQWRRLPSDLKSSVGVLDQGFNTTDLFHLKGGQIVRRYTGGETLGQRRAASALRELIENRTGRRVSLHEADEYLRQAGNGHKAELIVRGVPIDLNPLARQALDVAAGELRAYLSQLWEDGRQFDYILLTGGGVLALGSRLRSAFPNAFELPDPVTANARGLARFAQRPGVLPPIR